MKPTLATLTDAPPHDSLDTTEGGTLMAIDAGLGLSPPIDPDSRRLRTSLSVQVIGLDTGPELVR